MLRGVRWYLGGRQYKQFILDRLNHEGGTDGLSRDVGNQLPAYAG